jgi:hypothetical protein
MNDIFCFGDGFACDHIWPSWPSMIQALYPSNTVTNYGGIGAGHEFVVASIVEAHKNNSQGFFLVQWPHANRFDKLLVDDSWNDLIKTDPVYHFNTVTVGTKNWWLSSASESEQIKHYHNFYVQSEQAELRDFNYRYLVSDLLKNQSIFFSTREMQQFSKQDRFDLTRLDQIQPSPVVYMHYVEEFILPKMPAQPDQLLLGNLKSKILKQNWIPYDPDRKEIWQSIIETI